MIHSRLQALPRRHPALATPTPDFRDEDQELVEESPEDVFGAFLPHLFPDESPSFHGDPGQHLLYSSPRYGNLQIMVPSYPSQSSEDTEIVAGSENNNEGGNNVEEGRKLFAHLLWSAAMVVAEGVEIADSPREGFENTTKTQAREIWNVKDESVLELGAGAALPSLICALANACTVVVTDHPSSSALSGAIGFNMDYNLRNRSPPSPTKVSVQPHEWGVLDDSFGQQNKGAFTRIIAADCLWMRSQHENLARTLQWFLAPGGKVLAVAGFHSGRETVANFFEEVQKNGLEVEHVFERDCVSRTEDGGEIHREWRPQRKDEGVELGSRWCVVAVLTRK